MCKKIFVCEKCDNVVVSSESISTCKKCGSKMEEIVGVTYSDEQPKNEIVYSHNL